MNIKYDYSDRDWCNLDVLERNRLPIRPFYCSHSSIESALKLDASRSTHYESLNGIWKFFYLDNPYGECGAFEQVDFDDKEWDDIPVPAHWQLHGYGSPHYTDAESIFPVQDNPSIQTDNPTGIYRKEIEVNIDESLEYILRFDGVESAFHLWVNGKTAGYSQVSRMTSEFDITSLLKEGKNSIVLKVYQFCDGSYLENQDMWWLSGIFRDVSLLTRPSLHISDYKIISKLAEDNKGGDFSCRMKIENHSGNSSETHISIQISDKGRDIIQMKEILKLDAGQSEWITLETTLPEVKSWNAEKPSLYTAMICLCDEKISVCDYYPQRVGFKRVELKDGLILINGSALKIKGANRHDWYCETGRCVTRDQMKEDLLLMKSNNVNAVRTAHYPNQPYFYDLCDEIGLYVMAEADLECNQMYYAENVNRLSEDPKWESSYLDRVERMIRRDKNYPSILFWSLGNESGYGQNFKTCYDFAREYDPGRLVHYEEDRKAESADMYSSMYTTHEDLALLGLEKKDKPHIVCEYAHAMGNGPGGLKEYWEVFYSSPRLQGGFIWEWKDQSLSKTDEEGKTYQTYGGDYKDHPNSGTFCSDGIIQADGRPTPSLLQLKKVLEPVFIESFNQEKIEINLYNRYDFTDLSELDLLCSVSSSDKGTLFQKKIILPGIKPGFNDWISLFTDIEKKQYLSEYSGELWIHLSFLKEGRECAFWQYTFNSVHRSLSKKPVQPPIQIEEQANYFIIRGDHFTLEYDRIHGSIQEFTGDEKQNLFQNPYMNFWRAPIDNDLNVVKLWRKNHVDNIKCYVRSVELNSSSSELTITACKFYAPIVKEWFIEVEEILTVLSDGTLLLEVSGKPQGVLPESLPRIGFRFDLPADMNQVRWFGRGPEDCYSDSKIGSPLGMYSSLAADMYVPYVMPQEHGNRTDVRWVCFDSEEWGGLCFAALDTLNFSASSFSQENLEDAAHTTDLIPSDHLHLNLDYALHGLGSASWGPETLAEYSLKPEDFHFRWAVKSIRKGEDLLQSAAAVRAILNTRERKGDIHV